MHLLHFVLRTIFFQAALAGQPPVADDVSSLAGITELQLPPFRQGALAQDMPVQDLRFTNDGKLMLLGSSALWQWDIADHSLHRLKLSVAGEEPPEGPLHCLGSDDLSWFAASDSALYQVAWSDAHVRRFPFHGLGRTLGFAGSGDDYWLLLSHSLWQVDRYGKSLIPRFQFAELPVGTPTVYDSLRKTLWYAHERRLYRVNFSAQAQAPTVALTVKHKLLELQSAGKTGELVTHTKYAVLHLSAAGKIKRAIPVEGGRDLAVMAITPDAHAYLFSDQLLEVYFPKEHAARRYHLPLEETGGRPSFMRLNGAFLGIVVAGRPRLFHLDTPAGRR